MPHHTYEIAPAEDLVAEMLSLNVRAAVMYPKSMGFGTSDDICGPLLSALQEARIPVLFDVTELDIAGAVANIRHAVAEEDDAQVEAYCDELIDLLMEVEG